MAPRGAGRPTGGARRVAGLAGLAYGAGAAVENMEILEQPAIGATADEVRSAYADQALAIVTASAGALALVAYVAFAAALFAYLRSGARPGAWPALGLAGGIGGALLAGAALVAELTLLAGVDGLADGTVTDRFDFAVTARLASAPFVAAFLLGFGVAALRFDALPRALAAPACALAAPMALATTAALVDSDWLRIAAGAAFGLQALWIFAAGLWLTLADGSPAAVVVRRAVFVVLALAAGLVGLGLLAAPGASGRFFAWSLAPEPLAAFAGGVYVGSAIVYLAALTRPWEEVRGLVAAAALLSVSVLAITLSHLDQFDLDRLQAWAWIVLFAGFSLLTLALLASGRPERRAPGDRPLARSARFAFGVIALALAALALALWIDPVGIDGPAPFDLPPLGGRFAGSWVALVALVTGVAAVDGRADLARPAAVALVALPGLALVAAARTAADLEPAAAAFAYVAALAILAAAGAAVLASTR